MREVRNVNGHFVLIPVAVPICMKCGIASFVTLHPEDVLLHYETNPCGGTIQGALDRAAQCRDREDLEAQIRAMK